MHIKHLWFDDTYMIWWYKWYISQWKAQQCGGMGSAQTFCLKAQLGLRTQSNSLFLTLHSLILEKAFTIIHISKSNSWKNTTFDEFRISWPNRITLQNFRPKIFFTGLCWCYWPVYTHHQTAQSTGICGSRMSLLLERRGYQYKSTFLLQPYSLMRFLIITLWVDCLLKSSTHMPIRLRLLLGTLVSQLLRASHHFSVISRPILRLTQHMIWFFIWYCSPNCLPCVPTKHVANHVMTDHQCFLDVLCPHNSFQLS